ncbi:GDSL-type esterase/lipase family protein [Echinicola salinicaeni]|uniref:GDSL-type esterase/lipase family protein n=1 Tax=Echinicola salinicaeni TaxID=2762757 RepID=UPI001E3F5576|nr:GDSL-type esterase/lipase family protein [Echinicola salinicaeni]
MAQQPIKVACIGNSVTYGAGIKDRELNSYPARLEKLLGEAYTVKNFGHSGATLLRNGHNPYHLTDQYAEALSFQPDIAVIHLGLNDTDPRNWPNYQLDFEGDYSRLIDTLRSINPEIEIHIANLSPIFSGHPRFKSGTREWHQEIRQKIKGLAKTNKVELIDFYEPFISRPDLFPDNIHPNSAGAELMAKLVYAYLKKDFGGLSMPPVFGTGMVLQRGDSIPIFGKGDPGKLVEVRLSDKSVQIKVNKNGDWKAYLRNISAGGPYDLEVRHDHQVLNFSEVMVGDVWLSMGQSNMAFPLKSSLSWPEESRGENKDLHLFKFSPIEETSNMAWDSLVLQRVNELSYFEGSWHIDKSEFSAVAYHFGRTIQKEVDVPIGLIQIALGGTSIESFIDRTVLEGDELLVDMMDTWVTSDFIMPWVRKRAKVNLSNKWNSTQRHPYEPAYIYEAAIHDIIPYEVKGILWYQGESNTHNPGLYSRLFQNMVKDYREKWNNPLLPIYFVQLPGMSRPSWPYFRNMQNGLSKSILNIGMAVSLDIGDSLDVHPRAKKEVGKRLALLALSKTYQKDVLAEGPQILEVIPEGNNLAISFSNGAGLKTIDGGPVLGFELLNARGNRIATKGLIQGGKVLLQIPSGFDVSKVVYGFQPFSSANLVNKADLPLGTTVYKLFD